MALHPCIGLIAVVTLFLDFDFSITVILPDS